MCSQERKTVHVMNIIEELVAEEELVWNCYAVGLEAASSTRNRLNFVPHGKIVSQVHAFFSDLQPRKFCAKLTPKKRYDGIRLVQNHDKYPNSYNYTPTEPPPSALDERDMSLYKHVYSCVHWPILSSAGSSPSPSYSLSCAPDASTHYEAVAAESLAKHARNVFSFPIASAAKLEKEVRARQHTRVLIEELVNQLATLEQNRHPFYLPSSFSTRAGYERWQKMQRRRIESLIAKFWHQPLPSPTGHTDFLLKERHGEYRALVMRLMRYEAHCRRMEGTDDGLAIQLMSTASTRILQEYSLRYGIGDIYHYVALLSAFVERFDCSLWFLSSLSLLLDEVKDVLGVPSSRLVVTRAEYELLMESVDGLRENCANFIVHMKDRFPENKPPGGVALLIRLISQLKEVDLLLTDSATNCIHDDLRSYIKRSLQTVYEKHKAAAAESIGIAKAQRLTHSPKLLYTVLVYIKDEVLDYQINFQKDFLSYLDVTQLAALELYRHLMDDVISLSEEAAIRHDGGTIDILMLGLAYRLSCLDSDWASYVPSCEQRWRERFAQVHVLPWLNAVKLRAEALVEQACSADNFLALTVTKQPTPPTGCCKPAPSAQPIVSSQSSPFRVYTHAADHDVHGTQGSLPVPGSQPRGDLTLLHDGESLGPARKLTDSRGYIIIAPAAVEESQCSITPKLQQEEALPARDRKEQEETLPARDREEQQHRDRPMAASSGALAPVADAELRGSRSPPRNSVEKRSLSSNGSGKQESCFLDEGPSDGNVIASCSSGGPSSRSLATTRLNTGADDETRLPPSQRSTDEQYGGNPQPSSIAEESSDVTVLVSSSLVDVLVMTLRLENFLQTLIRAICTPSTVEIRETAGALRDSNGNLPLWEGSSVRGSSHQAKLAHAQNNLCGLALQVVCSTFVTLAQRLLLIDVDSAPEVVVEDCISVKMLTQLRKLGRTLAVAEQKERMDEKSWLLHLEENVNIKMCLRLNNVQSLEESFYFFCERLIKKSVVDCTDSREGLEAIMRHSTQQLHSIYEAQVALLARQIYYVLLQPSRVALTLKQYDNRSNLGGAMFQARVKNVIHSSFEASLKSAIAFLSHYLYQPIMSDVLYNIWLLLCQYFELQLKDLVLQTNCEKKAVVILTMMSCIIRHLTEKENCSCLSTERLLGDCEHLLFKLDLYSMSVRKLFCLYQDLLNKEQDGRRSSTDDSLASSADMHYAKQMGLELCYVERMRKELHSHKKCFSGHELCNYILAHPVTYNKANAEASSTVGEPEAHTVHGGLLQEMEHARAINEAIRIANALLRNGTIVSVDSLNNSIPRPRSSHTTISQASSLTSCTCTEDGVSTELCYENDLTIQDDGDSSTPRASPSQHADDSTGGARIVSADERACNRCVTTENDSHLSHTEHAEQDSDVPRICANFAAGSSALPPVIAGREDGVANGLFTDYITIPGFMLCLHCAAGGASDTSAGSDEIVMKTGSRKTQDSTGSPKLFDLPTESSHGTQSADFQRQPEVLSLAVTTNFIGRSEPEAGDLSPANSADGNSSDQWHWAAPGYVLQEKECSPDATDSLTSDSTAVQSCSLYCFASLLGQYYSWAQWQLGSTDSALPSAAARPLHGLQVARLVEQCMKYDVLASDVAAVLAARSRP